MSSGLNSSGSSEGSVRKGQVLLTGSLKRVLNTFRSSTQKAKVGELFVLGQTELCNEPLSQNKQTHKALSLAFRGLGPAALQRQSGKYMLGNESVFAGHLHSGSVLASGHGLSPDMVFSFPSIPCCDIFISAFAPEVTDEPQTLPCRLFPNPNWAGYPGTGLRITNC